jgi:polyhydroxyalkanoate synthesis regulator phasin
MSNVLTEIKRLLGMEIQLEQMTLDNGTVIEAEMFEVAEIKEPAPTQEETPEVEVEVEQAAEPTAPKKVIESTTKESHFSKEDVDALKSEIEALKTELASMKEVKEVELSAQPLTHNPDARPNVEKILYSQNRVLTTFDKVMSKIAN